MAVGGEQLRVADAKGRVQDLLRRRRHAGLLGPWHVLEAHHHLDLGAEVLAVELQRFLATAIEIQVGLHLHGFSFQDGDYGISASSSCASMVSDSCTPRLQASTVMTFGFTSFAIFISVPLKSLSCAIA